MEDQISIKEAAISSLESMENLVLTLSTPSYSLSSSSSHQFDCKEITDQTVSKLKKFISVLDRTGRARFRRGPVQTPPVTLLPQTHTLDFTKPRSDSCGKVTGKSQLFYDAFSLSLGSSADGKITGKCQFSDDTFTTSPPISGNSSFLSSITVDGSVTGGNLLNPTPGGKDTGKCQFLDDSFSISSPISGNASLLSSITADGSVTGGKVAVSNGRLPLSSSKKKDDSSGNHTPSASRCHCSKKRKERQRRSIRVPATSSRIADIPPDEGLWRKYGQKPIKRSPHPSPYDSRSYYKCSSFRGCPARKHVERAFDDVSMLVVTYEGEHRHVFPS